MVFLVLLLLDHCASKLVVYKECNGIYNRLLVSSFIGSALTYDPELLMKGLALLYQMNAPQHHAGGGKKRNQNFRRARRPHPQRRERREDEAKAG